MQLKINDDRAVKISVTTHICPPHVIIDLLHDRSVMLTRIEELEKYLDVVKEWEDQLCPGMLPRPENCRDCRMLQSVNTRCQQCAELYCAIQLQTLGFHDYKKGS